MKTNVLIKKRMLMGLMCLPLVVDGQSFPKIVGAGVWGPEEAQAGKEYTYKYKIV